MDDDDYEVHPLDRDYSVPRQPARNRRSEFSKLHRIGFFIFAAGFVTVVLAAIVLGAFPDVGWIETIGGFMHRLAMYFILIGGVLILVAYSAPRRAAAAREQEHRRLEHRLPSTIDDAAGASDASLGKPANLLGRVSVIIAAGTIILTMVSSYIFRFGINGRPSMAIMLTLSWLNLAGYPLALLCSWRAVCQSGYDQLPARIAGTLAIAGHLMLILHGIYWSRSSLMTVAVVIVVTCITSYIAKGQSTQQTHRGSGRLGQSGLGILVTSIAVAWLLVSTLEITQSGFLSTIFAGSIAQFILLLTGAMAIVSYWQINRDPYFAGFGALLIVVLPFLPMILLAWTSNSTAILWIFVVWVFVIGGVLARPLCRVACKSGVQAR